MRPFALTLSRDLKLIPSSLLIQKHLREDGREVSIVSIQAKRASSSLTSRSLLADFTFSRPTPPTPESTPGTETLSLDALKFSRIPESPRTSGRWERRRPSSRTLRRCVSSSAFPLFLSLAHLVFHLSSAFRPRDHARPLLAQHGRSDSAGVEELPPVPKRVRLEDPAVLEEQEGRDRGSPFQAERTRPARRKEGKEEIFAREHEAVRGRLPRRRREELEWSGAKECCWIELYVPEISR